jgi:hypothetical protein
LKRYRNLSNPDRFEVNAQVLIQPNIYYYYYFYCKKDVSHIEKLKKTRYENYARGDVAYCWISKSKSSKKNKENRL